MYVCNTNILENKALQTLSKILLLWNQETNVSQAEFTQIYIVVYLHSFAWFKAKPNSIKSLDSWLWSVQCHL